MGTTRQDALVQLRCLNWTRTPSQKANRRILAHKAYPEEVERLVREYNQQGQHGKVYALDGKAVRGMRRKDEEGHEYLLFERQFHWWCQVRCRHSSCEIQLGITSLTHQAVSRLQLLHMRRAHWEIETGLHYRRNVTLHEDATRMTVCNTDIVMASFNHLVLALL